MGWVSSPPLFCAASKTAADLSNSYLANPETPWRSYAPSKDIYATSPNYTASDNRIQMVEVYMDDFKGITQGDPDQQERVTELLLRDIKEFFRQYQRNSRTPLVSRRRYRAMDIGYHKRRSWDGF